MPSGTVETEISATPEQVWEVIADLERAPEWVPDLISVRRLDSGETRVGSRFEQVVNVQGRKVTVTVTIKEINPPHVIAHSGEGDSVKITGRIKLSGSDSGCHVTNEWGIELSGLLKLASPLAGAWTRKNIESSMEVLRKRFEQSSGSPR